MATQHNLREKTKPRCHEFPECDFTEVGNRHATRDAELGFSALRQVRPAARFRARAEGNDGVARRSGAVGVSGFELVDDAREGETAALHEQEQVIDQIGGFGNKLAIIIGNGGQGDFDAFLADFLRDP